MEEVQIIFLYEAKEIILICQKNEYMLNIFERFAKNVDADLKKIMFLYEGNEVIPEVKLEDIIKNNQNKIHIFVLENEDIDKEEERVKITFTYNGQNKIIECNRDEYMLDIYKRYALEIQVDLKNLFFLYKGSMVTKDEKLENIIKNNETNINMIVNELGNEKDNGININHSNAYVNIYFLYKGCKILLMCQKNEYMFNIFKRFELKVDADLKNLMFLYEGNLVIPEVKLEDIIKKNQNKIDMVVFEIEDMENEEVKITFTYNGQNKIIECNRDEYMLDIYKRYALEIQVDLKKLFFLYNGSMITQEVKLENIIKNNENNINMIVNELDYEEDKEVSLKQSKDIICPICNEICIINLNDYKITFSNCKNGQRFTKIMFDEFIDFQKIDESKIICDKCEGKEKIKKSEVNNNLFYKCCTCNINLCPLCKEKHNKIYVKKHLIINYDNKNYICNEHGERYISHCKECNKDLCDN